MASGLALGLAKGVLGKLGEVAVQAAWDEASLLLYFKSEFKWLEKKLRRICTSLQAADEHSEHNQDVKEWLGEVRNIAFDAEDIIDECAVEHLYRNACTQSCAFNCSQLLFRRKMTKRIRQLKERIGAAFHDAQELKLFHDVAHLSQPSTSTSQSERGAELRRGNFLQMDEPAVAIDYKVNEIQALLEDPAVRVVAAVGMGGLGKTFLLQHVFNRSKHRYECSAWISVSQTCSLKELQCDLASHIGLEIAFQISGLGISDVRGAELIHRELQGRRSLIVLDDVWRTSVQGDLISRLGLPSGRNNQCKVVVTTRSLDVARNMNAHIYEMQQLSEGESWDLFSVYAFAGNKPASEELESIAHQVVEECGRLPLAIKTVAASMAKSPLTSDWEAKLGQLKMVGKGEDSVMKILKLSYDSLPPYLKCCFAYLSFFPEDTYISYSNFPSYNATYEDYVIYLWIAEGFIPQEKGREQWDIGLDYIHQLANLCLLEVNRVYSSYTVHDMFLDLVVNICKEIECEFDLPSKETSCRRLLLGKKGIDTNVISQRHLNCQRFLRTLSFSQNPDIESIPKQMLEHVRLLRVIDLSHTAISSLPKCVGNFKLLMVLNLSYTQITKVPYCVRRLQNLQYLDASHCERLRCLPEWIGELKSLSHLDVRWCSEELHDNYMPKGISELLSLRTLRSGYLRLAAEESKFFTVGDVGNLINLRQISICLNDERGLRSLDDGVLDRLVNMRSLGVQSNIRATEEGDSEVSSLPELPEKMKLMKDLQQLSISRFSVPSWLCGMERLTDLVLHECSAYTSLQKMPNLQCLILKDDYKCRELPKEFGESGGFPKLAKLQIEDFPFLEELPALEEGAMQSLELLYIEKCPQVKRVPKGLEQVRRLKRVGVVEEGASEELKERLKEGGEDWNRIQANNPRIEIVFY